MEFHLVHSCLLAPSVGLALGPSRFDGEDCTYKVFATDLLEQPPVPKSLNHRIDRISALAINAVNVLNGKLPKAIASERIGLYVGNVFAGWAYGEPQLKNLVENGPSAVHPFQATAWFPAAIQGEVTILKQWKGIAKTFSGFQCAFAEALLGAMMSLLAGRIDAAIVGAIESNVDDFISWGAGIRTSNHSAAEGAFVILITAKDFGDGNKFEIGVMKKTQFYGECFEVEAPTQWIEKLSNGFDDLRSHYKSTFMLPLSDTTGLWIGS